VKSFFSELWRSLLRAIALPILALLISVFSFNLSRTDNVTLGVLFPFAIVTLVLLCALIDLSIRMFNKAQKRLPKVVQGRSPPSQFPNAAALLLLEHSDLFGHETVVSIFYRSDDFEEFIGLGYVLTIQENGLIQVVVNRSLGENRDQVWASVRANDANCVRRLLVKPSFPRTIGE